MEGRATPSGESDRGWGRGAQKFSFVQWKLETFQVEIHVGSWICKYQSRDEQRILWERVGRAPI